MPHKLPSPALTLLPRSAPARRQRVARWSVVLLLAVMFSGCTTRWAYNFLDWAIERRIQRYVSLQGEQRTQTRAAIADFHQWHRVTQLPIYADYLGELKARLEQDKAVTGAEIHAETDRVQLLLDKILTQVQPDVVTLLSSLSDAQVTELLDNVEKERQKFIDEHVNISDAKRRSELEKKFTGHFTHWSGNLTRAQRSQVQKWAEEYEDHAAQSAEQRETWQAELAAMLTQREDREALMQGIQALMFYRTDNWDPELREKMRRNQTRTYELIADLLNNLNDRQQRRLMSRFDHYIDSARRLATSAEPIDSDQPEPEAEVATADGL